MSRPQWPLYRPVGRNPRTTSPDTGQASAAQEGEAIDVASKTVARSEVTLLHRRHRTVNLPDVEAPVKGSVDDVATVRPLISMRIVARSTAPV